MNAGHSNPRFVDGGPEMIVFGMVFMPKCNANIKNNKTINKSKLWFVTKKVYDIVMLFISWLMRNEVPNQKNPR